MTFLKSVATISILTLVSRITGFARDIMIARTLGAGLAADAFFTAFKLPNLFRRLFAEGAFSAAFIPLYTTTIEVDGRAKADVFASRVLSMLIIILIVIISLAELIMPWILLLFAPGFHYTPSKMDMAVELARITFPYLLFISVVSLQAGVLNSLHRFASAAATPVLLNLSMISCLLGAAPFTTSPAYALAWGVSVAGIFQLFWLSRSCTWAGIRLRLCWPYLDGRIRLLGQRILPVAFGAGLYQVNLVIDTILASLVSDGAVSFLYYADRISQLPLGVVGIAVGTALLPLLSHQISSGCEESATISQNRAVEFALLLATPAAIALIILADPIVSVLFEHGAFGADKRVATASALAAFAIGLPAYILNKVLTPGFFARHDTVTPARVAAIASGTNLLLSLILMRPLAHVGIALSSAISAWFNVVMLGTILYHRGQLLFDTRLKDRITRLAIISLIMGGLLMAVKESLMPFGDTVWIQIGEIAVLVTGGFVTFASLAHFSGTTNLLDLRDLRRQFGKNLS